MQNVPFHQQELDILKPIIIAADSLLAPSSTKMPALGRNQPVAILPIESPAADNEENMQQDKSPRPVSWDDVQNNGNGDDCDIDQENGVCSIGIQEFPIIISENLTLQLMQAPSAFRGVKHDETGGVVWGASICLARFLAADLVLTGQTVLELGCGMGVPSLVAAKNGASRVIATDMEDKTLQQLDEVAKRNNCQDQLELSKLNWHDSYDEAGDNRHHPLYKLLVDIILASDVIYHDQMVDSLVQTIDKYLSKAGTLYIALRNTRQGVRRFWQEALPDAGFKLVQSISCTEYQGEESASSELPPGFQNKAHSHRWRGDHSIYVFKRSAKQANDSDSPPRS